ncbi:MAG: YegP family protein [Bacteroidota bacterium]
MGYFLSLEKYLIIKYDDLIIMKNSKFEIYKDKAGEFRFRLKAKNGENILQSEGYASKQGCQKAVESVKKNAANEDQFEKRTAKNGQHYFVLKAGNGEVIGMSEMYKSTSGRDNGIGAVGRAVADSVTDDLTSNPTE